MEDYKNKLELAKERYNNPKISIEEKKFIEYIFPELRESKDERIRKLLIDIVKVNSCGRTLKDIDTLEYQNCLAWLEKQGEQKPADKIEQSCYHNDGLYYAIDILEKTLGKVEGYQSDDGIIEHQTAIETCIVLYHKISSELLVEINKRTFD